MTIPSVTSSGYLNAADSQASSTQRRTDFQTLATALNSGDLSAAQQAFAQLQLDSPRLAQALSSPADASGNPRLTALQNLASALKSGDLAGAQSAFAQLGHGVKGAHHGHGHHHHGAPAATTPVNADATGSSDGSTGVGSIIDTSA